MKRLTALLFFICAYIEVSAQAFAIINDIDGFVNVREKPNAKSKIRGKLSNQEIFNYDNESKGDWIQIYRQDNRNYGLEGYIHKSKLFPLSKFKSLTKVNIRNNRCIATNDSLSIEIVSAKFSHKKHILKYSTCKDCGSILNTIDAKPFWGTDGGIPKTQIQLIKLTQNGRAVEISQKAYKDIYEPNFETLKIYLGNQNILYIQMNNSDGAGGYSVIWVIKDGKYLKRYIDNSFA